MPTDRKSAWVQPALGALVILLFGSLHLHAGQAPPAAASTNDPACGSTNLSAYSGPIRPQPESTLRMVRRLQENNQKANPFQDRFLSDRRADAVMAALARNRT